MRNSLNMTHTAAFKERLGRVCVIGKDFSFFVAQTFWLTVIQQRCSSTTHHRRSATTTLWLKTPLNSCPLSNNTSYHSHRVATTCRNSRIRCNGWSWRLVNGSSPWRYCTSGDAVFTIIERVRKVSGQQLQQVYKMEKYRFAQQLPYVSVKKTFSVKCKNTFKVD